MARRTKVNGRRGIYYREARDGKRRYEITYLDSNGVRRWQTVDGNLAVAESVLEDLSVRKRKGEQVAPTKERFSEYFSTWLEMQGELRPKTRRLYRWAYEVHLRPHLGRLRLTDITVEDVARLVASMRERGYSGHTIRAVLTPLSKSLGRAARKGLIARNPVAGLESGERPTLRSREMRILDREEIAALLSACEPPYRALVALSLFTGLRKSEALGLVWRDVDLEAGYVHVRKQLGVAGDRVEPKTQQAVRDVVLFPELVKLLREHRIAAKPEHSLPGSFVFSSSTGTALDVRNATRRGLEPALRRASLAAPGQGCDSLSIPELVAEAKRLGLDVSGRIRRRRLLAAVRDAEKAETGQTWFRWHDMRHTAASLLIALGEDVVWVSNQLGHANPSITLNVYAKLFNQRDHAETTRRRQQEAFGNLVETSAGNSRETESGEGVANLAELRPARSG